VAANPLKVLPTRLLFTIESELTQPSDVAVGPQGRIYVLDGVNNRIKVFDQRGRYLYGFGREGEKSGELRFPLGLDIDPGGRVYVADSGNHRIQILSSEGEYVSQIRVPAGPQGKPADPTDVAVDESRRRLYVVDNDNHRLLIYDQSTFKLVDSWGQPGTDDKEFRFPFFLALNTEGNLYVVDVINTRVQIINPDGKFLGYLGRWGVEPGQFYRPKGIAVGGDNRVFVSDGWLGVIQVFDADRNFVSAIGDEKGELRKFESPVGLSVDQNKRLYVVEMMANKVTVLSIQD
jgi:DNA-binding beta-propeller fold protein YncE